MITQTTRSFRIFVSSTFADLEAERNALQKDVFPRLRDLATVHGCRFQAIDLRWGISEESSREQQTMKICLGEIERCQQTSPRPNFIALLGDRYGSRLPPAQIRDEEFNQILEVTKTEEDKALLKEWYFLDQNAVPCEWCMKPRELGYENWRLIESRLHAILADAARKLNFTPKQLLPYIASATEQEIHAGILNVKEAAGHTFCFFRNIEGLPQQFNASKFLELVEARLEQEFSDGLSESSQKLVKTILETGTNSSAKDFANRIKEVLKHTAKASPEEETVKFVRQVMVDYTARDFQDLDQEEWTVDKEARDKQTTLKERLLEYIPQNVFPFQAHWNDNGLTTDHIGTLPGELEKCMPLLEDHYLPRTLCEAVWRSLACIIQKEIKHPHIITVAEEKVAHIRLDDALDAEGLAHRKFAEEHLHIFVGREDMLAKIADYLADSKRRCLTIVGAGGTGKSTLIASAIQQNQENHPNAEIVYRFIGVTPSSSDGRSLLDSLCHEISRRYGANESDVPTDYRNLVPELGKRMGLASADRPLILFLDSLDQLSSSQDARSLIWLPNELPEGVSVIASTREEDTLKALRSKQAREERLGGLSRKEGDDLLSQWLASVRRTLQGTQRQEVLDKFEQSQGNPLYLKLAFEEARLWPSGSGKPREHLASEVKGIIEKNMIERLKSEDKHGEALVSHALGYLAASRYGLAEDELLDLLSRDLQVYEWFFKKSYHFPPDLVEWAKQYRHVHLTGSVKGEEPSPEEEDRAALAWLKEIREAWPPDISDPLKKVADFLTEVLPKADGPRLPVVLWSRLSFDLAPYMTERMVDGSPLLNFYHRELGDATMAVFLSKGKDQPYHERLANYFRFRANPARDGSWTGNYPRGLSELPYHLTRAALFDEVYKTLTDFKFLEHKAAEVGLLERKDEKGNSVKTYTGVLQLQDDFEQALKAMPGGGGGMGDQAPLILTALETSKGLMVYCPVCNKYSPIKKEMLDSVITCPQETCKAPLNLNPFTVKREV